MSYDLVDFDVPGIGGAVLRAYTALVENPWTRGVVLPPLLRTFGVDRFRRAEFEEVPSPVPPLQKGVEVARGGVGGGADVASFLASGWCEGLASGGLEGGVDGPAGVFEYARAYRAGEVTPEDVARAVLEAVADSNRGPKPLRAVIRCDAEDLLEQARASGERFRAGKPLGILDGVPVAVKDELDQRPYPTMVGTSFLGERPAADDATSVARLRSAGALLIGKTNMHEIGIGVTGVNAHHGAVRNPYDPARVAGGSSGGSAAAVAAGLCAVALGADGGGSIRIPAALCGGVGLKPTFGRISEVGAFPLCWSMGHIGPIGWWTRDVALAYALMAGPDSGDRWTQGQPPVELPGEAGGLEGVRLGVYRPWFEHADPVRVEVCWQLLKELERRGARVVEVEIPELDATRLAHVITIFVEMAASLRAAYEARKEAFGLDTRVSLAIARSFSGADYVQAQRMRTRAVRHFSSALEKADVIVTPATPVAPPRIPEAYLPEGRSDLATTSGLMRFVFPANLIGFPAITFPAGHDGDGCPVGLHVMGRPWEEALLLRIGMIADRIVGRRVPRVHYRLLESV